MMVASVAQTSVIEVALRRDRLVVAAGLSLVAATAWAWTLAGVGMPMSGPAGGTGMSEAIGSAATTAAAWSPA
jgi:predicted metal-binding membrane protein